MTSSDHFKSEQAKLVYFNSKQFKEAEKQRRAQAERDYWRDYHNDADEDHDWDREPDIKETNTIKEEV